MKNKTFWDIERSRKRAARVLFLLFFPFFTLSLVGLFYLVMFILAGRPGGNFWEILAVASAISLVLYFIGKSGANRRRILEYLAFLRAQEPDLQDLKHKQTQNVVREMAIAASVKEPKLYIIPVLAKNAFSAFDIIAVTEGAVSGLDRDELQAVVAHEMAHYLRGDSYYKGIISTFLMTVTSLFGLSMAVSGGRQEDRGFRRGLASGRMWFLVAYLYLVQIMARLLNAAISRKMEELADARAVQFTRNPLALASALYKIARDRVRGLASFASPALSPLFIVPPTVSSLDEGKGLFSNLFSSHPPINKRIQLLLNMAHSDLGRLRDRVLRRRPRGDWWVEMEGKWLGPFTLEQLMEKTWLREGARIKGKEGEFVFGPGFLQKFKKTQGQCPRCGGPLFNVRYEFVPVVKCGRCGGILVREDRVMKLIARLEELLTKGEEKLYLEDLEKKKRVLLEKGANPWAVDPSEPLVCPFCGKPMERRFFNFVTYTPVDYCRKCGVIFFDSGELEIIISGLHRIVSLYK